MSDQRKGWIGCATCAELQRRGAMLRCDVMSMSWPQWIPVDPPCGSHHELWIPRRSYPLPELRGYSMICNGKDNKE